MNREIKFKRYHYSFNGKFLNVSEWGFIDGSFVSPASLSGEDKSLAADCQYTGLKDKNGREIYDGDVIERIYRYEVRFKNGSFYGYNPKGSLSAREIAADMLIIGNIYENPELLNK